MATSGEPKTFGFFSATQAEEVEAIATQIIPSDGTPGAREARVIHFIDRALTTFNREQQKVYAKGLRDLQERVRKQFPRKRRFSKLGPEQQVELLKTIEKSPFFGAVRTHTIMGFLANPEYGGNRDRVGWKAIGFEDAFSYEPPFGFYDRDYKEGK